MAHAINDECVNCGACEPECPNEAIRDGDDHYEIDVTLCNECEDTGHGPACLDACPVPEAIVAAV